jgi:hypothetical protein
MVSQMLSRAINELQNLQSGEVFLVKDLFKGYEWNRFAKNDRLRLGILFITEVNSKNTLSISVLAKTSSNQQRYMKN